MKSNSLRVTAWTSTHEFLSVSDAVLSCNYNRWNWALDKMRVWRTRVDRLPAGVEITQNLMEAKIFVSDQQQGSSSSVISMTATSAINRFLSMLMGLCERQMGTTKYYDVASKLGIPSWVVRLRHESTHGDMPAQDEVLEALDVAIRWMFVNYWQQQKEEIETPVQQPRETIFSPEARELSDCREKLHNLLDCYGYVKLYSTWGTKTIGQLKDQQDLYTHVTELWRSCRASSADEDVDSVRTKTAAKTLLAELKKYVSQPRDVQAERVLIQTVVNVLLHEELLIPSPESLESVFEKDDEEQLLKNLQLPANMRAQWSDVIVTFLDMDSFDLALIEGLFNAATDAPNEMRRTLSCAWLLEILRSSVNDADDDRKGPRIKMRGAVKKLLLKCIRRPSEANLLLLPHLSGLLTPALSRSQEARLSQLQSIWLGHDSDKVEDEGSIVHTVQELLEGGKEETEEVPEGHEWQVASDVDWSSMPLGIARDQELETLHSELASMSDCSEETETVHLSDKHATAVVRLDWASLLGGRMKRKGGQELRKQSFSEPDVPEFYRNEQEKRRGGEKKKRRV